MAISFVAFAGAAGIAAVTPAMPAGATTGDLLILTIEGEGEDTNADSPPTGGAWTAIGTGTRASATDGLTDRTRLSAYWAWYDSGINRVVPDAGNHTLAVISAWRGVDATTPFDGVTPVYSSSATNNVQINVAGVTGVSAGSAIVVVSVAGDNNATAYPGGSAYYSGWTNTNLTGLTEVVDVGTNAGSDGAMGIAWGTLTGGGSSTTTNAFFTVSEEEANVCFALRVAATGTDYTETATDDADVTDATSRAVDAVRTILSGTGVGVTDSVSTVGVVKRVTVTEAVGVTDVVSGGGLNLLYMRAAAGAVDPGDTDITDYLVSLGHTITEIADNASVPGNIATYDALIIGATVAGSAAPGGTFSTVAIPVLALNAFPLDEMDIAEIHTDQASQTQMYVIDYTHPVFTEAGIGANGVQTITAVSMTQTANYAAFGPDHVSLAAYGTAGSNGVLIGLYESGDTMDNSHVAEARRIYFTVREMVTTGDYNSTWYDVFRGCLYWAAGIVSDVFHESVTEPVGVTDDTSRIVDFVRTSTEAVGVTDAVTTAKTVAVTITDGVGVADATSSAAARSKSIVDQVGGAVLSPYATIPDTSFVATDTDLDIRMDVQFGVLGTTQFLIAKGIQDEEEFMLSATRSAGVSRLTYSWNNGTRTVTSSASGDINIKDGQRIQIRVFHDRSTGEVWMYVRDTGDLASTTGFVLGHYGTATASAWLNRLTPINIGARDGLDLFDGTIFRSRVILGGTTLFDADFSKQTQGAGSFIEDAQSKTVTIVGSLDATGSVDDATSRVHDAVRTATESVNVADVVSDNENNRETLTDPVGVTDNTSRIADFVRSIVSAGATPVSYYDYEGYSDNDTISTVDNGSGDPLAYVSGSGTATWVADSDLTPQEGSMASRARVNASGGAGSVIAGWTSLGLGNVVLLEQWVHFVDGGLSGNSLLYLRLRDSGGSILGVVQFIPVGAGGILVMNDSGGQIGQITEFSYASHMDQWLRVVAKINDNTGDWEFELYDAAGSLIGSDSGTGGTFGSVDQYTVTWSEGSIGGSAVDVHLDRHRLYDTWDITASTEGDQVGVTDNVVASLMVTKTATDPVGVTDDTARIASFVRSVTDPVGATDNVFQAKTITATITDAVGVTDLAIDNLTIGAVDYTETATDPVGVTDATASAKAATRSTTEPVAVTDSISRIATFVRTVTEPIGVSDQVSDNENNRETIPNAVGVTDDTTRIVDFVRSVTESVGVEDLASDQILTGYTEASTEDVGVTDDTLHVVDAVRSITDAVGVADNTASVKTISVTITDDVGVTDTALASSGITAIVTEAVAVTDQTARVHDAVRSTTEAVTVDDVISENETNRESTTNPVNVTDSTSRIHDAVRIATEDLGVTDQVLDVKAITVTITDDVGVGDQALVALSVARTITDDAGVTDSTSRVWDAVRTVTNQVGITDAAVQAGDNIESKTEPVGVTDSVVRVHGAVRSATDDIGVADNVSAALTASRTVTEDLGVTDTTPRVAEAYRTVAEAVGVTDVVTTQEAGAGQEFSTEPVGVTDNTSRIHAAVRTITDDLGVADQTLPAKAIYVTITEVVGITDQTSVSELDAFTETSNESVAITDQVAKVSIITRTITDAVGITDVVTDDLQVGGQLTETSNEPINVTDQVSRLAPASRALLESVGISDSTPRVHDAVRSTTDPVGVTDATSPTKVITVVVTETIGVTSTTSTTKATSTFVTETVGITDTTSRVAPAYRTTTELVGVTDPVNYGSVLIYLVTETVGVTDFASGYAYIQYIDTELGPKRSYSGVKSRTLVNQERTLRDGERKLLGG